MLLLFVLSIGIYKDVVIKKDKVSQTFVWEICLK